jgi:hypothetical protein
MPNLEGAIYPSQTSNTWNATQTVGVQAVVHGAVGSKKVIITSNADPILQVQRNPMSNDNPTYSGVESALIENLVIRGNGTNVGILLNDVYNCQIRNVTLENCAVGIRLLNTNHWSEVNHIEHVRMENVGKGIEFIDVNGALQRSFMSTYIEDVGISLMNESGKIGIDISGKCKPYSSFIKANVWIHNADNNIGMMVRCDNPANNDTAGEVMYGLINLNVSQLGTLGTGYGLWIQPTSERSVYNNYIESGPGSPPCPPPWQGFFIAGSGLNQIKNDQNGYYWDDVKDVTV